MSHRDTDPWETLPKTKEMASANTLPCLQHKHLTICAIQCSSGIQYLTCLCCTLHPPVWPVSAPAMQVPFPRRLAWTLPTLHPPTVHLQCLGLLGDDSGWSPPAGGHALPFQNHMPYPPTLCVVASASSWADEQYHLVKSVYPTISKTGDMVDFPNS